MYHAFFSKAQELLDKQVPFATAIVVRAEKPTSGKPGDKALITADGTMYGWVGGSCAQPTVIREALKALKDGRERFVRLSPNPADLTPREGLLDFGITCFSGGTLEIYIEPQFPQPRLLIVGVLPAARALVALGKAMNYDVVAVDPDGDGHGLEEAHHVVRALTEIPQFVHPETYAVIATHGSFDETALEQVLKAKPRYIGLVASKKRFESVKDYLKMQGIAESELARIKAPAGLDIHAQGGDEIALSILAEIVQYRRSAQQAADWSAVEETTETTETAAVPVSGIAIDPVCKMEVNIATAKFTYEHEGVMYYFCAPSCKMSFRKNPEAYINPAFTLDPVCGMQLEIASAQHSSEYHGQTYYFCSEGCKTTFDLDPQEYATVMHHH